MILVFFLFVKIPVANEKSRKNPDNVRGVPQRGGPLPNQIVSGKTTNRSRRTIGLTSVGTSLCPNTPKSGLSPQTIECIRKCVGRHIQREIRSAGVNPKNDLLVGLTYFYTLNCLFIVLFCYTANAQIIT